MRRLAKMTALENPLRALQVFGQSVWLDYIRRSLITSGELRRLIDDDGLRGRDLEPGDLREGDRRAAPTTAICSRRSDGARARRQDASTSGSPIRDIQDAADALRPVYDADRRRDGYVSLEVSPLLAVDTAGTLDEARRLWHDGRPREPHDQGPGDAAGHPAIEQLIGEGINVNVTLLFAQDAYEQVADAYLAGLERFARRGRRPVRGWPASPASSSAASTRAVDARLEETLAGGHDAREARAAASLLGQGRDRQRQAGLPALPGDLQRPALAGARRAAARRRSACSGPAPAPRTRATRDVLYVEELIGPDTVNTCRPATLDAFRDHGRPRASLREDVDAARRHAWPPSPKLGISLEGDHRPAARRRRAPVRRRRSTSCSRPSIGEAATAGAAGASTGMTYTLPGAAGRRGRGDRSRSGRRSGKVRRLWQRDASLWTGKDEAQWLGWLGITERPARARPALRADRRRHQGGAASRTSLLLGMGGSSLCPEVMRQTFGKMRRLPRAARPRLHRPGAGAGRRGRDRSRAHAVHRLEQVGRDARAEHLQAVLLRAREAGGRRERGGRRFIAITDPGSKMQQVAEGDGFRHDLLRRAEHRRALLGAVRLRPGAGGGRWASTSPTFLDRSRGDGPRLHALVPADENPGVVLGAILGVAAQAVGRDKVTIVASPGIARLGAWLEQLIAESTGKDGKGLIPIDREPLGRAGGLRRRPPLRLPAARRRRPTPRRTRRIEALERAGHPVVRIALDDPVRPRRGVLPLGDRHRRRRLHPRHQSVRSARRRGEQDRDPRS